MLPPSLRFASLVKCMPAAGAGHIKEGGCMSMSGSLSAAREIAFRVKLLVGLAGLGGLGGGLLYLGWLTDWRELTLQQYLIVLQKVLFEFDAARRAFLLSAAAGAVLLLMPALVFYIRRSLSK
jgi:hypothetical protein